MGDFLRLMEKRLELEISDTIKGIIRTPEACRVPEIPDSHKKERTPNVPDRSLCAEHCLLSLPEASSRHYMKSIVRDTKHAANKCSAI